MCAVIKRNFHGIARKKTLGPKCFVKAMHTRSSSFNQLVVHTVTATDRMDYDESFGKRNELL